jgi:hypothetical protein
MVGWTWTDMIDHQDHHGCWTLVGLHQVEHQGIGCKEQTSRKASSWTGLEINGRTPSAQ